VAQFGRAGLPGWGQTQVFGGEEKDWQGSQWQPDHGVIYGGLPIGTRLEIVKISRWFYSEVGTFWLSYATILEGGFTGRRVLLPWYSSTDLPWIESGLGPKGLDDPDAMADPRFLTSCQSGGEATKCK
jgi:hypothetical protein